MSNVDEGGSNNIEIAFVIFRSMEGRERSLYAYNIPRTFTWHLIGDLRIYGGNVVIFKINYIFWKKRVWKCCYDKRKPGERYIPEFMGKY